MDNLPKTSEEWKKILDPDVYKITRESGTEPPFSGKYVEHKEDGIYVCSNCGAALFDSKKKYDSGSGWPSFTDIADGGAVEFKEDDTHGMHRVEVRCVRCQAHLGHVFDDGPAPSGKRFCINSASLDFNRRT